MLCECAMAVEASHHRPARVPHPSWSRACHAEVPIFVADRGMGFVQIDVISNHTIVFDRVVRYVHPFSFLPNFGKYTRKSTKNLTILSNYQKLVRFILATI
jgi:hypothetical protein